MNNLNWERLRILRTVLDTPSLAEAARQLGLSQPTVSRQIKALEREYGAPLVDSTPDGSRPTPAGLHLAPALEQMFRAAASLHDLGSDTGEIETVRITVGPWLGAFLSQHIQDLLGEPVDTRVEIDSGVAFADLPRREADIAIRNQRPRNPHLTVKRLPDYGFAAYGLAKLVKDRPEAFDERRFSAFDWATLATELEHLPTMRWLSERLAQPPVARFSLSTNLLDAVESGRVLAYLPCFAAERRKSLIRLSEPRIPSYGGHWLVLADDMRRRPNVWRLAERIVQLLETKAKLLLPDQGPQ